jgi:acetolactate decarboxylase
MRKIFSSVFLIIFAIVSLNALDLPSNDDDILFQVSTLGAIQEGVYDGVVAMKELKLHGDFGIGTFDGLDGEMTLLNGIFYQIKSDGKVYKIDESVKTPFAVVTKFDADKKFDIKEQMDYKHLQEFIVSKLDRKMKG